MNKMDDMGNKQFIFGALLVTANRMDTLLERELREFGITSKQWMLSIIVDSLFAEPPPIREVAVQMGSSHQNVKQLALKLEQKGLLKLEKDRKDARVTRLKMTEESTEFWKKTEPRGVEFVDRVFENIPEEEIAAARIVLDKILNNLMKMENTKVERDE